MSRLPFQVRTLKSVVHSSGPPLTKEANQPLQLHVQPYGGRVHIVLEFAQTCKIKNIICKNAGTASGHMAAAAVGEASMRGKERRHVHGLTDPHFILDELPALVPETQLCSAAQASAPGAAAHREGPLWKVRSFAWSKTSRFVRDRSFKFLLLELRPFMDQLPATPQGVPVGINWVEVYGEAAPEPDEQTLAAWLAESALIGSRSAAAMVSGGGGEGDAARSIKEVWAKDPAAEAAQRSKRGLDAFQPTGAAERALREEQAREPPRKRPAMASAADAAAAAARPILNRNASFMQGLREGSQQQPTNGAAASPAAAAASGPKPPPSCPRHPGQTLLQRVDRKQDPPRTFFVCTAKDAAGHSCDTKIYKE